MWKSCSNALGVLRSQFGGGARSEFRGNAGGFARNARSGSAGRPETAGGVLTLLLVVLALTSGLILAAAPVLADVSVSVTARAYDEEDSRIRTVKVTMAKDTVRFDEEAVPLGELREESSEEESEGEAERDEGRKVIPLKSGPRIEIDKGNKGSINIEIGDEYYEEGKDVVKFGEDVEIEKDRVVDGDVVVVGGSLTVNGTIKGDAVCVGGTLTVSSTGTIEGDAVNVGGTVVKEPDAKIVGDEVSTGDFLPGWIFSGPWPRYGLRFAGFTAFFMKALIVLLIIWILSLVLSDRIKVVAGTAAKRPLASFGLGLLIFLLTPIAMVLLCITIVGIPVAILLPIGLIIVGFLGYAGIAYAFGSKLFRSGVGIVRATIIGVLILEAIPLVGKLLCAVGGPLCIIGVPIRIVGYAVIACAISMGLGAAILSKLGQQPRQVWGWIPPAGPGQTPRWEPPPPGYVPPGRPGPGTPGTPGAPSPGTPMPGTPGTPGTPAPGTPTPGVTPSSTPPAGTTP